jgi:hypothetical protein
VTNNGNEQGAPQPIPGPRVIDPNAVASVDGWTAFLGLSPTCLRREARLGRLRVSRRGGKYFVRGQWLIDWLERGAATKRRANTAAGT